MCDDDENDYKAYERMHSNRNSYYSPEYEHRMGREKGYDYEARSYQYPYSRYDREELDRDSKRYREDECLCHIAKLLPILRSVWYLRCQS